MPVYVDVNQQEANAQGAELMIAVLPKTGRIISTQMSSRIHVDHFEPLLTLAQTVRHFTRHTHHAKPPHRWIPLSPVPHLVDFSNPHIAVFPLL